MVLEQRAVMRGGRRVRGGMVVRVCARAQIRACGERMGCALGSTGWLQERHAATAAACGFHHCLPPLADKEGTRTAET